MNIEKIDIIFLKYYNIMYNQLITGCRLASVGGIAMLEIKRNSYSVIALNKQKSLGIAFPTNKNVLLGEFVKEVISEASKIDNIIDIVLLSFDEEEEQMYLPMEKFLDGKDPSILDNDEVVEELYEFYFKNAVPQIVSSGVNYIFIG